MTCFIKLCTYLKIIDEQSNSDIEKKEAMIMINIDGITIFEDLGEIVAPGHSCLVVWDVQAGLFSGVKVRVTCQVRHLSRGGEFPYMV